jgi:hypothetical protein
MDTCQDRGCENTFGHTADFARKMAPYLHRLESVGTLQQRQIGLNTLFMKPGSSSC